MKLLIDWIKDRFFYRNSEPEEPINQTGVRVRPRAPQQRPTKPPPPEFEAGLDGRIEDGGPGKNVLVRNKYLQEDSDNDESLKILDHDMDEPGEEDGIDPYNTGRFDRSKYWDYSRNRK